MITLVLVALIFGVLNAVIAPIIKLLSLPFIILTLGLFLLVINAGCSCSPAGSPCSSASAHVDGFWTAVGGAIIVTLSTWLLEAVLHD